MSSTSPGTSSAEGNEARYRDLARYFVDARGYEEHLENTYENAEARLEDLRQLRARDAVAVVAHLQQHAVATLGGYGWIVLTSAKGVDRLWAER